MTQELLDILIVYIHARMRKQRRFVFPWKNMGQSDAATAEIQQEHAESQIETIPQNQVICGEI